jgi:pimeloyl-ACP methyl ester carboxylesterase
VQDQAKPPLTEPWLASGQRLGYDPGTRIIDPASPLKVWIRVDGDPTHAVTFLPGYPDGSIGWGKVLPHLPDANVMPKIFVEYVGMGDSDKPRNYPYSTAERTDLVEAIWRHFGVSSTIAVTFDFSSLVVLEHLARLLERPVAAPQIDGAFIFNGGLFVDGHTHPWFTTPLLKRLDGITFLSNGPFATFKPIAEIMWSKRYRSKYPAAWEKEARDLYAALKRNDGLFYLYRAAGFVDEHCAQGKRLDFGRIFDAYSGRISFVVGGSDEDPFEPRQVRLAEQRLSKRGLAIVRLPGGHLTTYEHPQALAHLIGDFVASVEPQATPPRDRQGATTHSRPAADRGLAVAVEQER